VRCAGSGQARGNDFGYWLLWSWWGLNLQILRRWLAGCDLLEISCRLGIQVVVSSECDASGAKVKAGLLCRRSSQSSQCSPSVGLITLPNQLLGQWIYLCVDRQQWIAVEPWQRKGALSPEVLSFQRRRYSQMLRPIRTSDETILSGDIAAASSLLGWNR
jgi:hypothetical protein